MKKEKKKSSVGFRFLCVVGIPLLVIAWFFGWLTLAEYRPEDVETVEIGGEASQLLYPGSTVSILTWNTGYGALGDDADFFMDGGSHVFTADKERVLENVDSMISEITALDPDIIFLQETDVDSSRSHRINETELFMDALSGYQSTFAYNFRAILIPYPVPPIGKVNSGILTLCRYPVSESSRVQLPCPFSWPLRIANLKRCLMIDRVPVYGSDKELVLINLHLEAFDDGEGKRAQTEQLLSVIEAERLAGNYVIAGGDFNQIFSSYEDTFPSLEGTWQPGEIDADAFGGAWQLLTDPDVPSCRSLDRPYLGADKDGFQYYLIDGFIVSADLDVLSIETQDLDFAVSDHNPILMRIRLPAAY